MIFIEAALVLFLSVVQEPLPLRAVEGRVTDQDGEPVAGATIEWGHFSADREDRELYKTDLDGRYRIETRKIGPDFRVGVSAAGFAPAWRDRVIPKQLAESPPQIDFSLRIPITLTGKITDPAGKPMEGVTVRVQSPSTGIFSSFSHPTPSYPFPGPERKSTTNARGEFMLRYLPETETDSKAPEKGFKYQLQFLRDDSMRIGPMVFSESQNWVRVTKDFVGGSNREGIFRGKVSDAATGAPIREFKIVRRFEPEMLEFQDESGHFELMGLQAGSRYQVHVYAEGYAPKTIRELALRKMDGRHEILLTQSPSLQGRVVTSSGVPIPGARLVFGVIPQARRSIPSFDWGAFEEMVDGHLTSLQQVQRQETGKDGRFSFCHAANERLGLAIIANGFQRRLIWHDEMKGLIRDGILEIPLGPESRITGQVFKNGKPEPNAELRLQFAEWSTQDFGEIQADADGKFDMRSLPAGKAFLSVYQSSGSKATARTSQLLSLGEGEHCEIEFGNPTGAYSISGKATPFALITASKTAYDDLPEPGNAPYLSVGTIVDPDGNYMLQGLERAPYRITQVDASALSSVIGDSGAKVIDVRSNAQHDFNSSDSPFTFGPSR